MELTGDGARDLSGADAGAVPHQPVLRSLVGLAHPVRPSVVLIVTRLL